MKTGDPIKYTLTILMSMLLLNPGPIGAEDELSDILKGIRKRYGHLPGLSVTYEREIITKSMAILGETKKTDLASGQFYFKPPYFLRVEQKTPNPETVLSDGETLWWFIPRKERVYRYPSEQLGRELRLLCDIFHGLRAAEEDFQLVLKGSNNKGERQLILTPNPPWPEIHHIQLSVAGGDHTIRVVEMYNYLGGITRFTLGHLTAQEQFKEGFFTFVVPEGVKVIEGQ